MLFYKDSNIPYTEMCIFFDNNFFTDERDDEKCFRYLYLIFLMLAFKKRYFQNYSDYDDFAEYAASTVYIRFLRKWEKGIKNKSILNYAKSSIYYLKVGFQREHYREVLDPNRINVDTETLHEQLRDNVQQSYNYDIEETTLDIFNNVSSIIWSIINNSPYKNDMIICRRLYLSIYLTLLKEMTFSSVNKRRIELRLKKGESIDSTTLKKMLKQECSRDVVVWRLHESMTDYVKVLVNCVKVELEKKLKKTIDYYRLPDDVLDAILNTSWEQIVVKTAPEYGEF